ncbi:hypothetical protein CNR22_06725 [Sphingobacteriaceae bacterium]|nr:hypothetical protein CNR22_06725 [Sphingobacteriaceae bacterium]
MFKKIIFSFLAIIGSFCFAQKNDSSFHVFKQVEKNLQSLQKKTFFSRIEKERIEGNKEFMREWEKIVADPKIMDYAFDSLREVSILIPKDKKFKLITWNLPLENGTHAFFGYLLVNTSKKVKTGFMKHEVQFSYEFFRLIDRSATVKNPETYIGTTDKWFGMLYTQLVQGNDYYTLIGWDGNDKLTQRKFIDVLYFRGDGTPVFGKDVFRFPKKNPKRIMFEWSQEVSMSVKYNEKRDIILFSHLVPKERGSVLEGQFQYYGPDAQFDAFERQKDRWVLVENVEANSAIDPLKPSKKPDPRKNKKRMPDYKAK